MSFNHESKPEIWDCFWTRKDWAPVTNSTLLQCINEVMGGNITGKKILEVGCGKAGDSLALTRMGADCYVLDFSNTALTISRNLAEGQKVKLISVMADAKALPFADNSFDLVFSQGLIEHYQPPDLLISEQKRVVRPGGFVLIDVPQLFSLQAISKRILMGIGRWPFGWEKDYTENQLKEILDKLGLEFVTSYGWGLGPVLGLGLRSRLSKILNISTISSEEKQKNRNAVFQRQWVTKHCLNNYIGVVGKKP
ncbi:class I SAM-dependent methyltransferase [Candidatus Bathyarchaeota archaeon]|nr:class I SAM-dependent methyltransferase [Candidatus Bathyarchaeota archaeon]